VTRLAAGTAGQVLTSNGAGTAPTYQTASGGYATIQSSGASVTQRPTLNVLGLGFAIDNPSSSRTDVYVEGPFATPSVGNAIYIPCIPVAAQSIASGTAIWQAFRIYRTISVNQYAVHTPAGAASATARFGIYTDGGGNYGNLISGTEVSGVSLATSGVKFGNFTSVQLTGSSSGTTYWICTAIQGATCTMTSWTPTLGTQNPGLDNFTVSAVFTVKQTGVTGSLPSNNPFSGTVETIGIRTSLARSA
jgi:hypothetical protein